MQALYARALSGDEVEHVLRHLVLPPFEDDPDLRQFAERLFLRTIDHADEADALIAKHAQNWDIERIALVDRIVLRMAITELLTFPDVPPKVTINEAIEVAKAYSTPRSGTFVNGILDAVLKTLQAEGRLTKSGRGLVDFTPPVRSR